MWRIAIKLSTTFQGHVKLLELTHGIFTGKFPLGYFSSEMRLFDKYDDNIFDIIWLTKRIKIRNKYL